MPEESTPAFFADQPYPEICVQSPNMLWGRWMLDNMSGVNSEMSAVSLYFYNHLIISDCYEDIRRVFHQISMVEMHHMEIFGKLAFQLGENPRLWFTNRNRKIYWSPSFNQYPIEIRHLLHHALDGEMAAIKKYENQLCRINDPNICENLTRILMDEKLHVRIFEDLICSHNF